MAANGAVNAAEVVKTDSPYCNVILQGTIGDGDAETFKAAVNDAAKAADERLRLHAAAEEYNLKMGGIQPAPGSLAAEVKQKLFKPMKIPNTAYEEFQRKEFAEPALLGEMHIVHVCLNSEGGSFAEAHKIIRYMTAGDGVATVVRGGDTCFSACALIFMFGNIRTFGDNRFFDRRLHVRGKLGFHAPYIDAENVVPEEVARIAYQQGIAAVADMLELDHKGFLNRSFVVDFLRKGPGESLDLDTVGKAGEWLVELFGYKIPDTVTAEMGSQACSNDIAWSARRRVTSNAATLPTKYDMGRNFLKGAPEPVVFPGARLRTIDETHWLFAQPTSDADNEKTDSRCCIIKMKRYQTPVPALAMRIEQEKVIDANSLCPDKPSAPINVPNKRSLVGPEGFGETTPAWFVYPPTTTLSSIAAD